MQMFKTWSIDLAYVQFLPFISLSSPPPPPLLLLPLPPPLPPSFLVYSSRELESLMVELASIVAGTQG